jgi:hypothetical protein
MFVYILTILYSLIFLFIIVRFVREKAPQTWRKYFSPSSSKVTYDTDKRVVAKKYNETENAREEEIILQ